jgi:hypothetical protein
MNTLFAFLASAVGPLALRVVAALGLGILTFTGVDTVLSNLIASAQSNWASVASDILGLASVARVPECLGLLAGAMTSRVTMWVAANAARWTDSD